MPQAQHHTARGREGYTEHLYILDKDQQIVPFVPNRAQSDYRGKLTGRDLLLKARQLGFSTDIQARGFTEAMQHTTLMATLAHDDQTTQKLRRMAGRFYDNLPADLKPARGLDNATTTTYPHTQSEITIATAGSTQVGRGGTYSRVHGSEVAFWKDAASIMAGIMQGVPKHGAIELESTPNGAQGWFYERCMEALDGDSDWTLHFYQWWWDDGYQLPLADGETLDYTDDEQRLTSLHNLAPEQIKWRRAKQRELKHLFAQEYPEDPRSCFLLSGTGYFGNLEGVFTAPDGAVWDSLHEYYAGLDFAQTVDYTVLSIIDKTTGQQVALLRINRLEWSEMRRQVVNLCKKFRVKLLVAEENSMGSTNIEELRKLLASAAWGTGTLDHTRLSAFKTTNMSKAAAMASLHEALHEGRLKLLDDPNQKREMMAFQSKQTITGLWQLSAPEGEHDDIVIANALAWNGVAGRRQLTVEVGRWA